MNYFFQYYNETIIQNDQNQCQNEVNLAELPGRTSKQNK